MERGAGSEIADYGGFPLNEAGRLWALSYDPSRVTLRHHQCDAYVTPYQMRATRQLPHLGGARPAHAAAGRDSCLGADDRRPSRDLDGRPAASAGVGAAHVPRVLDRPVRRQRAGGEDDAHEARLAAPQRHAAERPGDDDRLLRTPRRSPHQRHGRRPIRCSSPNRWCEATTISRQPVDHRRLAVRVRRRRADSRSRPDDVCRTTCSASSRS